MIVVPCIRPSFKSSSVIVTRLHSRHDRIYRIYHTLAVCRKPAQSGSSRFGMTGRCVHATGCEVEERKVIRLSRCFSGKGLAMLREELWHCRTVIRW